MPNEAPAEPNGPHAATALSQKGGRARAAGRIASRDGPALLSPPPLPAADHPAGDLVVSPLHPQLSRCGGAPCRTRARYLLRNGAALGVEVRSPARVPAAAEAPATERPVAFGRDGRAHRREDDVSVARR